MKAIAGPVDAELTDLVRLLMRLRRVPPSAWPTKERDEYAKLVRRLMEFSFQVGLFVTANTWWIEDACQSTLEDLAGRVRRMSWCPNARWRGFIVSRSRPISVWFVKTFREQLHYSMIGPPMDQSWTSPTVSAEEARRRLETAAVYLVPLRFPQRKCDRTGKAYQPVAPPTDFCVRGCEALLMKELRFHDESIAFLQGVSRSTIVNRLVNCAEHFRRLEKAKTGATDQRS